MTMNVCCSEFHLLCLYINIYIQSYATSVHVLKNELSSVNEATDNRSIKWRHSQLVIGGSY